MANPNHCWSDLPVELLCLIQKHLPLADYLRFGAVCRWWRFVTELRLHRPAAGPPWLMLPRPRGNHDSIVRFISSDDKIYSFPLPVEGFYSRLFLGSSNGWLITLDRTAKVHLLNPLTGAQFQLPPFGICPAHMLDGFHRWAPYPMGCLSPAFGKSILTVPAGGSITTLDRGYTVATIQSMSNNAYVAVTSDGSNRWSRLLQADSPYRDIIFYDGLLCAITDRAWLNVCDLSAGTTPDTEPVFIIPPPRRLLWDPPKEDQFYLVESSGDLLLVVVAAPATRTKDWIYKLDLGERREWKEIRSLGERALFMGPRAESTSLSVRGFPQLMENCLYLSDGVSARPLDPGVMTTPQTMAYISIFSSLKQEYYSLPLWDRIAFYSHRLWFTPSM